MSKKYFLLILSFIIAACSEPKVDVEWVSKTKIADIGPKIPDNLTIEQFREHVQNQSEYFDFDGRFVAAVFGVYTHKIIRSMSVDVNSESLDVEDIFEIKPKTSEAMDIQRKVLQNLAGKNIAEIVLEVAEEFPESPIVQCDQSQSENIASLKDTFKKTLKVIESEYFPPEVSSSLERNIQPSYRQVLKLGYMKVASCEELLGLNPREIIRLGLQNKLNL
ncbi:hypothetical protein QWY77_04250 [Thalassotalea ponticola]|uniref:hypothetical protein n=1 Tax=Thalassotalea ponticola TaxID=1523392 RepID=UPI0025B5128F|nr:hypothetical protein [Thalassotalea ponticola]MDN3651978.1 hypothetical protein [Thalassotalea ponticola]